MSAQTISVSVDGVTTAVQGLRCGFVLNGIGDCSFSVTDPSGAFAPSDGDAVVVTLGGSPFWTGEITEAQHEFLGPTSGTLTRVTAQNATAKLARALHNAIYPSGTLEALIDIVTGVGGNWTDVGITKDAGQVTGPTLDIITAAWTDGLTLARYVSDLSGYVFHVDANDAIKFWSPGSVSSGVTLSLANGNVEHARWQQDRWDYRNRVWVVFGPSEVRTVTDPFNGDNTSRDFAARYHVAAAPGAVTLTDGFTTSVEPVGVYGVDTMEWTWDASYGTYGGLRQQISSTPLSTSWLITVAYASQFPNYVFVEDAGEVAARGQWNDVLTATEITDVDEATAAGAAYIRTSIPRPTVCQATTRTDGITVGSTVVVSLSEIGLSATMLVQRVEVAFEKSEANADPYYTLDLVSGSELADTAAALFQRIVGGTTASASGGSVSGGSVTTTTIVAGSIEGDLGGSRLSGVVHTTWTPTREHREWRCQADGTYVAHMEVWTDDAGTSVQPRVYDITGSAAAVTGTASTSTTAAKQTLTFAASAGHDYRLELLPQNSTNAVFGLGKVRA